MIMGTKKHIAAIAGIILLLQLIACQGEIRDNKNGRRTGEGISHQQMAQSVVLELEVQEDRLKQKLDQRADDFNGRLRRIEEFVGKAGIEKLGEADLHLLTMAGSQHLLKEAVRLRKDAENLLLIPIENVVNEANAAKTHFQNAIAALREVLPPQQEQDLSTESEEIGALILNEAIVFSGNVDSLSFFVEHFVHRSQVVTGGNSLWGKLMLWGWEKEGHATENLRNQLEDRRMGLDRIVRTLARLVSQKPNPFAQLQKAGEVLDLASHLRKAMAELAEKERRGEVTEKREESNEWTQHTVRAYNNFARKLELLRDGPRRSLYGQIDLAAIDRKIEEEMMATMELVREEAVREEAKNLRVVDADFWKFIRRLIHDYYKIGLPQMAEIKIRNTRRLHIILCIGLIEYDYFDGGTRRRKFREDLDEYTSDNLLEKATPLAAHTRLVSLAKGDDVFFQMVQHGWDGQSCSIEDGRVCGSFVWQFLCQLFDGKCPEKEKMPFNFFAPTKSLSPYQPVTLKESQQNDSYDCVLKRHQVRLQFVGSGLDSAMPPIIEYTTGKFHGRFHLVESFTVQEQTEHDDSSSSSSSSSSGGSAFGGDELEIGVHSSGNRGKLTSKPTQNYYKANLMAYVCEGKVGGQKHAYLENVRVFGQKNQKLQLKMVEKSGGSGGGFQFKHLNLMKILNNEYSLEFSAIAG